MYDFEMKGFKSFNSVTCWSEVKTTKTISNASHVISLRRHTLWYRQYRTKQFYRLIFEDHLPASPRPSIVLTIPI